MVFVTVGSQMFQFNRLLKEVDDLLEKGVIQEKVFAQTGKCTYVPKHYEYKPFVEGDEFNEYLNACSVLITHGGAGTIVNALKKNKRVLAVPRLKKYGEHVDDHQLQILGEFESSGMIVVCHDGESFEEKYLQTICKGNVSFESNTERWIRELDQYISSL